MLRLSYFSLIWKLPVITIIHKLIKPINEPSSCRPISLLPVLEKIFKQVVLKQIRSTIKSQKIIPNNQNHGKPFMNLPDPTNCHQNCHRNYLNT